jgi:hypothetical protein
MTEELINTISDDKLLILPEFKVVTEVYSPYTQSGGDRHELTSMLIKNMSLLGNKL